MLKSVDNPDPLTGNSFPLVAIIVTPTYASNYGSVAASDDITSQYQ